MFAISYNTTNICDRMQSTHIVVGSILSALGQALLVGAWCPRHTPCRTLCQEPPTFTTVCFAHSRYTSIAGLSAGNINNPGFMFTPSNIPPPPIHFHVYLRGIPIYYKYNLCLRIKCHFSLAAYIVYTALINKPFLVLPPIFLHG